MTCLFIFFSTALAEDDARYKLPAPNACYVDPTEMPKFLAPKEVANRHGAGRKTTEGFMIRQCYIKDAQIVIPKGGLLYFGSGSAYFSTLTGEPIVIAGKGAIFLDQQEAMVIKKNFFVPRKKRPVPLGEDGTIAIFPTYYNDRYYGVRVGKIKYVFANGHAGWEKSVMLPQDGLGKSIGTIAYGYLKGEGMIVPPPLQYFGDTYNAFNSTYVVVDKLGPKGFQVKEAGGPEIIWFKFSYDQPIIADDMAIGQSVAVGNYQIKVLSIDQKMGTAKVALLDSKGNVLSEKRLGPLTLETYKVKNLIHHSMEIRRSLVLDYEKIRIQLNTKYIPIFPPGPQKLINESGDFIPVPQAKEVSTFHGGKVDLVIYDNIKKIELRRPWTEDPRFVFNTHYT
jgi:hypothetical protein